MNELTYFVVDYINEGVYGAFNCIMFDHQKVTPKPLCLDGSFHFPSKLDLAPASVWGPTCDSIDLVCPNTLLPKALRTGDWLGFDAMGAYTICAASQFNGFKLSRVVYTTGDVWGKEILKTLSAFKGAIDAQQQRA